MYSSHVAIPTRSSPQPILFAPHGAPTFTPRRAAVGAASRSVDDHAIAPDAFAFHPGAGA